MKIYSGRTDQRKINQGLLSNLYFWRDNSGNEIDVLLYQAGDLYPIEIKSGKTITTDFFKGLLFWRKLVSDAPGAVVYGGDTDQNRIQVTSWLNLSKLLFCNNNST